MSDTVDWMDEADDDILELMREDHIFEPSQISDEGICRGPHAAYRCRELAERGLLNKQITGVYDITDLGERYLEGDIDPSDLTAEE